MKIRSKKFCYEIITVLVAVFCISKVIRGMNTTSTQEGGFWNYITLLYYGVFLVGIIAKRNFKTNSIFISLFLYSLCSMFIALILTKIGSLYSIYNFLTIPYGFFVFSSFYIFTIQSNTGEKILVFTYVVCLIINLVSISNYLFRGGNRAVASDVYYSLCLFPFALVLVKNTTAKNLLIGLQFAVSFLSNKRTGLIALIVGMILYYIISGYIKGTRTKVKNLLKSIFFICIVLMVFAVISSAIDNRYGLGIYRRLMLLSEDQGSGRANMYSMIWNAYKQSPMINKLIGHGMSTAGKVVDAGYAHNDFLEILYNYGIPSFVCLVTFYISMTKEALRMVKRRSVYAPVFVFSLVVGLMLSMFSYFLIYFTYVTGIVAFWGWVLKSEKSRMDRDHEVDDGKEQRS